MMINDQQITVDFDGRKWILPELTLVKVGLFCNSILSVTGIDNPFILHTMCCIYHTVLIAYHRLNNMKRTRWFKWKMMPLMSVTYKMVMVHGMRA